MPEVGDTRVVWLDDQRDIGMKFCWIPPGEFRMGSRYGHSDEQPVHRVIFEEGFWLGRTAVTQRQFAVCFPKHKNGFPDQDEHPAESLTWHDARRYCHWINEHKLGGQEWLADLPTEAQWEYACRAGSETEYYTGDGEQALARAGWYGNYSGGLTHAVGLKMPNAFGLKDMHGNVWEWCRDVGSAPVYRHREHCRLELIKAGKPVAETDESARIVRGGAYFDLPVDCRSAFRYGNPPVYADHAQGFRVGLFPGPSCPVK